MDEASRMAKMELKDLEDKRKDGKRGGGGGRKRGRAGDDMDGGDEYVGFRKRIKGGGGSAGGDRGRGKKRGRRN